MKYIKIVVFGESASATVQYVTVYYYIQYYMQLFMVACHILRNLGNYFGNLFNLQSLQVTKRTA